MSRVELKSRSGVLNFPLKAAYDIRNCSYEARKDGPVVDRTLLNEETPPRADFPVDPDYVPEPGWEGVDPFATLGSAHSVFVPCLHPAQL